MPTKNKAILISKSSLESYRIIKHENYEIAYYLQTACGKTICEDALLICPVQNEMLLAICDGVGSSPRSYRAAIKTLESLQACSSLAYPDQIKTLLGDVNKKLCQILGQPKTTLTLVVMVQNKYYLMQIGDSGLIHAGGRGRLKHKSNSHSPVGQALIRQEISEKEALMHPDLYLVDNILGGEDFYVETSRARQLSRYDTLILTSDGLLDNLTSIQLINLIKAKSMNLVCSQLVECCKSYHCPSNEQGFNKIDDISFIIVKRTS